MRIDRALEQVKKFVDACTDLVSQDPALAEAESASLRFKLDRLHDNAGELCKSPKVGNTDQANDRG